MFRKKFNNPESPFLVSIGAGKNQVRLIKEAQNTGLRVIGVDTSCSAPGFSSCDLKIHESIINYRDIYVKLRELVMDGDIAGVMTKSYGDAIKTTSFLAEKFQLPFLPFSRSDDFISKKKMKSVFRKHGIPSPSLYRTGGEQGILRLAGKKVFPLISKPDRGHAKTDVKLISDPESLLELAGHAGAQNRNMLFEEYIRGDEIIAAGIICNGKYYLADISDKQTTAPPCFVDLMHVSPSRHYHLSKKITDLGQAVADAFDINTAPLIMEIIVGENNDLYVIEAVPEFGGEYLADIVIPERTGYAFVREAVRAFTGRGFTPPEAHTRGAVAVKYLTGVNGTISSWNRKALSGDTDIILSEIFINEGAPVTSPETNHHRIGVVIARGMSPGEAVEAAESAAEKLEICITEQT